MNQEASESTVGDQPSGPRPAPFSAESWWSEPSSVAAPPAPSGPLHHGAGPVPKPPAAPVARPRRGSLVVGVLVGMLLSSFLVGGGYLLGRGDIGTDAGSGLPLATTGSAVPTVGSADQADDDGLVSLFEPVTSVAAKVAPSVVSVSTVDGQGSGIIWDAERGYIVTNNHVVDGATEVSVRLGSGIEVSGEVVGGDWARDVAVIKVDPTGLDLQAATFAPSASVELGQLAVAVGSPFGLSETVTAGIVSAVGRVNPSGGSDPSRPVPVEMVQTDAPINPGNSGGALANRFGEVIGMPTSIRTDGISMDNAGVGFAVQSDTIVLIAERIVNGESLELGFLGVSTRNPNDGLGGAVVAEVFDGTAAELAGLESGDRILSVDGRTVTSSDALAAGIKFFRPGERIEIEVDRNGVQLVINVTMGLY
jgi:putative serine protease PepD